MFSKISPNLKLTFPISSEVNPTGIFAISVGDPISCLEAFGSGIIVGTMIGSLQIIEPNVHNRTTTLTVSSDECVRGAFLEQQRSG